MCFLEYIEMKCWMFICLIRAGTNAVGEQFEFRRRWSMIEFRNSSGSSLSSKPQPGGVGSLLASKENQDLYRSQFIPSGSRNESYSKVFVTDSSQENRQGQQAFARSFEGIGTHLSICLGLCGQPSALITELWKAQSLQDESRSKGEGGTCLSHLQHIIQGGCHCQAGHGWHLSATRAQLSHQCIHWDPMALL